MARYFFDLHECGEIFRDEDGVERSTMDGLRGEALTAARGVMCAELAEGHLCLSCHIKVRNEANQVVLTLAFKDAVALTGL